MPTHPPTPPVVVIGVGNPYRRDDGVGPAVIALLRERHLCGVDLVETDGEAAALIAMWDRRRLAILVDAVCADPPHPGRVHRLTVPRPSIERARAANSHGMDLGDTVELARELGRLPERMTVYAVEAADTDLGPDLTPAVAAAAHHIADEIAADIAANEQRTSQ
jgi:hydrogenase maturation protease